MERSMERTQVALLALAAGSLFLALLRMLGPAADPYDAYIAAAAANSPQLRAMEAAAGREFAPGVVPVGPDALVVIGYALANVVLLRGPAGCAVIDTAESLEAALEIRAALEAAMGGPCNVTDIVYTHNHADHVYGARAFTEWTPASAKARIWAHKDLPSIHRHTTILTGRVHFTRAMRQFGTLFPASSSSGIGRRLRMNADLTVAYLPPTDFPSAFPADIRLAGLPARLLHIPGETDDQMAVFLPTSRTLFCADDLYKAFPNLYAIRGTTFRRPAAWADSLTRMAALNAVHLVPAHTRPLSGEKEVKAVLTAYRDAILFVHDQTVRYLNQDLPPDEIVRRIGAQLPGRLGDNEFLRPLYGTVAWSVRSLYAGYLGWFSGAPEDLDPLPRPEKARMLAQLAGGPARLLDAAEKALAGGQVQWALELSSAAVRLEDKAEDAAYRAKAADVRVKALIQAAHRQTSANGHNYLLTCALEALGRADPRPHAKFTRAAVRSMHLHDLFAALAVRYKAEQCAAVERRAVFRFSDTRRAVALTLRNGVVLVDSGEDAGSSPAPDVEVETTETVWREIMTGERSAAVAVAVTGDLKVRPEPGALRDLMDCFERQE